MNLAVAFKLNVSEVHWIVMCEHAAPHPPNVMVSPSDSFVFFTRTPFHRQPFVEPRSVIIQYRSLSGLPAVHTFF